MRIFIGLGIFVALLVVFVVGCNMVVTNYAKDRVYDDVHAIPHRGVGLVLGTSPYYKGVRNFYYDNRITAAAELYKAGKVDLLIVSGGDYCDQDGYDEPMAMRDSLVSQGVPIDRILLDRNGTRTLLSIFNIRDRYRVDNITIISQKYHNERALYQAHYLGVDAIAYNAELPDLRWKKVKNLGREYLARVKLFLDLWFLL